MHTMVLGLDVGTASTKAVLFDLAGAERATATVAYPLQTPRPGWVEQDPARLWDAVVTAIGRVMGQAGKDVPVRALAIAAQSGSLVPADAHGEPVHPIVTWMDGRSAGLVERWRAEGVEERVRATSGWSLHPGLCLPTIAWLRQNDPATFAAARRFLSVNDFIVHRLTGRFGTNPSNGGGMQLVDIRSGQWSESLCALAGIEPERLSPLRPSGTIMGSVAPDVARATGLSSETLVVNGGHDQGCTALALGMFESGPFLLAGGTAWVITGVTDTPDVARIPPALDMNFHTLPGRWTVSRSLGGLGASLEWWVNQAWRGLDGRPPADRDALFAALNRELAGTAPGGEGLFFLPLTGGHQDPATTRAGGFVGLRLGHSRADMARAILEGAAYELRWALASVTGAGLPVEALWMVGGAARSPFWPQILADVTGVPIHRLRYDNWPALGAAILAGVGAGVFETIQGGLARFRKPEREIVPDEALFDFYRERYAMYRQYLRQFV